jgi:hypothetical protein
VNDGKPFLRISQLVDGNLVTICDVIPVTGTAAEMLARLRRIYGSDKARSEDGQVWIELYDANEDLTDEREMIRQEQAPWLLGTFFKLPRKAWRAFRAQLEPTP